MTFESPATRRRITLSQDDSLGEGESGGADYDEFVELSDEEVGEEEGSYEHGQKQRHGHGVVREEDLDEAKDAAALLQKCSKCASNPARLTETPRHSRTRCAAPIVSSQHTQPT